MKRLITILFALSVGYGWAQTVTTPPPGSKPYGTPIAVPDGRLMVGKTGSYTFIPTKSYTDSLIALGWTKTQVDSAIVDQVGRINFPVTSVQGMTGEISLTPADLGLGNVDNTSDADKPVSTAQQAALDGKEPAFSKGSLVAGSGVILDGTLSNRLVGSGNVTVNAVPPDLSIYEVKANKALDLSVINNSLYPTTSAVFGNFVGNGITGNNLTGFAGATLSSGHTGTSVYSASGASVAGLPTSSNSFHVMSLYGGGTNSSYLALAVSGSGYTGSMWFSNRQGATWYKVATEGWVTSNFSSSVFTRSVNGLVPSSGSDTGTKRYLDDSGSWTVPAGGGGSTPTDLSIQNRTSTTLQIGSSTGSAATMPVATTSLGGLMPASDKAKLDGININSYVLRSGDNMTGQLAIESNSTYQLSLLRTGSGGVNIGKGGSGTPFVLNFTPISGGTHATFTGASYYEFDNNLLASGTTSTNWTSAYNRSITGIGLSGGVLSINRQDGGAPWAVDLDSRYLTTSYAPSWASISGKPTTFVPSPHSHSASDINSGTLAIARIPTGTTGSTVALGNHTHPFSAITGNPTTLSGYGITDAVPSSRTINSKALSSNVTLTASDVSAVPLSGNATISGTKTFSSSVIAPQFQGTSTTASSSIPTNAQSLFKASVNSGTTYTLTNMTGNPRHIQVMITNTSSSAINVTFNANMATSSQNPTIPGNGTAIFTFLIENGAAWGTKTTF